MFKHIETILDNKFTPEKAQEIIVFNNYEGQRRLHKNRIEEYSKKMLDGRWILGYIVIAILVYDGMRKIIVNGQHQLLAVLEALTTVRTTVTYYKCHSRKEVSDLFRQFDEYSRTLAEIGVSVAAALGFPKERAWITTLALSGLILKDNKQARTKEEKTDLLLDNMPGLNFIDKLLGSGKKGGKHMIRGSVACVMIELEEINTIEALKFFTQIRDGELLQQDDATFQAREFLKSISFTLGGVERNKGKTLVTPDVCRRKLYSAWNSFMKGNGTSSGLKIYRDKPFPKLLAKRIK